ncbi:hypothetical protein B1750_gp236 [Noumeavirus]|uniref:Uncharacterized protein n=1 Tax=Marseillevirus sp. TaxID=2809551 RepID=A0AA96IYL1_9VIRU|nr:hypothetical protein B1750_gp236 [Noumeavirus]AQM73217.1 hypothetical protein NMV_236 [Noumeavirus]QZX43772.1 hypothetical protein MarQu_190 [Marseillevirus sp.]WNL50326.1 hypothetical protein MarDSR_287 [Marseillevirus sp.]
MAAWKTLDHQSLLAFVETLLKNAKITDQQISEALPSNRPTTCRFKAQRGNAEVCGQQSVVPYGFCSKHKATVQAKQAKDAFEKEQKELQEKKVEPQKVEVKEEKKQTVISIRKNSFGNWQHTETGIIFRNIDKKAYGTQAADGKISPLTPKEVEYCKQRKWSYVAPADEEDSDEDEEEYEEDSEAEEEEQEDDEDEEENEDQTEQEEEDDDEENEDDEED